MDQAEIIDQLKARYRKEALRAVEEAEIRGFERAREEAGNSMKLLEEECRQWKAVATGLSQSEGDTIGENLLVKYVMEQVYRDVKRECSGPGDNIEFVEKMKHVLIRSTNTLLHKLPKIALIDPTKERNKAKSTGQDPVVVEKIVYKTVAQDVQILRRPSVLCVRSAALALPLLVRVQIPATVEQNSNRLLRSNFVAYVIEAEVHSLLDSNLELTGSKLKPVTFRQERRYREFQTLYSRLKREFGESILPKLPDISGKLDQTDSKIYRRRRQLCLWLQYLLLHSGMLCSVPTVRFLADDNFSGDAATTTNSFSGGSNHVNPVTGGAHKLSVDGFDRSSFQPPVIFQAAIEETSRRMQVLKAGLTNIGESGELQSKSRQILVREIALREINTTQRDLEQLSPQLKNAATSCRSYMSALLEQGECFHINVNCLRLVALLEPEESMETRAWRTVEDAFVEIYPVYPCISEVLQCGLFEHITFFGDNCLASAQQLIQQTRHTTDNPNATDETRIVAATNLGREWDNCRRIRHSVLIEQLRGTAIELASEYRRMIQIWQQAANDLMKLTGSPLEFQSKSGKKDAEDLLRSFGDNSSAATMQRMFARTAGGGNDENGASSTKGALKHNSLRRPLVPHGVRREPSRTSRASFAPLPEETRQAPLAKKKPVDSRQDAPARKKAAAPENVIPKNCNEEEEDTPMNRARREEMERRRQKDLEDEAAAAAAAAASATAMSREAAYEDSAERRAQMRLKRAKQQGGSGTPGAVVGETGASRRPKVKAPSNLSEEFDVHAPRPAEAASTKLGTKSGHDFGEVASAMQSGYFHDVSAPVASQVVPPNPAMSATRRKPRSASADANETPAVPLHQQRSSESIPDTQPRQQTQTAYVSSVEGLPEGWEQVVAEDGSVYYFHRVTRMSRWEKPDESVAAAVQTRLEELKRKEDDAINRRREERQEQRKQQEALAQQAELLQTNVNKKIMAWRNPAMFGGRARELYELLASLHTVSDLVTEESCGALTKSSTPNEVKKAYLKAARLVHPDKLAPDLDLETRLTAEAAFVVLSEAYEIFRKNHGG